MLWRILIALGSVVMVTVVGVETFAVEEMERPLAEEESTGGAAQATTWTVCSSGCDFASIQAAVDAASDGDTVQLGAETFYVDEPVEINKAVGVRGQGPASTVVMGSPEPLFLVTNLGTLEAVTVRTADGLQLGVLIRENGGRVERCVIEGTVSRYDQKLWIGGLKQAAYPSL